MIAGSSELPESRAEIVTIPGPQGPLVGALLVPADARYLVLIVPGSGPTDRDGNAPSVLRSDTYKLLAEALAANGVATLRIDKRGMFGSAQAVSDPNAVTIAAYAGDVRNWVIFAAQRVSRVWIAGHSEGGLVALAAAKDPPDPLCGLILLATPGRPLGQILLEQIARKGDGAGLQAEAETIVAELTCGRFVADEKIPAPLKGLFPMAVQGFWADLFRQDPVALATEWRGPALIVQGDADLQISPQDAVRLTRAMPSATLLLLEGGTHTLKADVPGEPLATYTNPALPLHPGVLPAILAALHQAQP